MKRLTATLQKEEDMYIAHCPEIGTVSQGKTIKSALANLKEATQLYLEEFPKKNTIILNSCHGRKIQSRIFTDINSM